MTRLFEEYKSELEKLNHKLIVETHTIKREEFIKNLSDEVEELNDIGEISQYDFETLCNYEKWLEDNSDGNS